MKTLVRLGFMAAAFLLLAAAPLGADPAPAPQILATLTLADGRVLHNARIMPNEGNLVAIHADEGLLLVAKSLLPVGMVAPPQVGQTAPADPGMMMQSFDPNQAPAQDPEAKPVPKVKPVPNVPGTPKSAAPRAAVNAVFKGCSVVSFEPKAFQNVQGCAEVVIRNDTDNVVLLTPRDILCLTAEGARHQGRFFVTDGFPPGIKRREFVPAQGQIDDVVTFTDDKIDIASVQWTR
jgi:hypothetical protein